MPYHVKILTPSFKKKVDELVTIEIEASLKRKHVPLDRKTFAAEFEQIMVWDSFYEMWNHPEVFPAKVTEYYKEMGVLTPEFSEMVLDEAEQGLQSKPRVIWNGHPQKIDDIQEIFSYKKV
jgi:hypothetical protein